MVKIKTLYHNIHAFYRNAIHFELLYIGFLLNIVQTFYIQKKNKTKKNSRISFQFKGYIILQDMGIRFLV